MLTVLIYAATIPVVASAAFMAGAWWASKPRTPDDEVALGAEGWAYWEDRP